MVVRIKSLCSGVILKEKFYCVETADNGSSMKTLSQTGLPRAFAQRLRQRREELGMHKQDMADRVGVSLTTIQKYENGQMHGFICLFFEKREQMNVCQCKKTKKQSDSGTESTDYLERNQASESTTFLVIDFCCIWIYILLFAAWRVADGF